MQSSHVSLVAPDGRKKQRSGRDEWFEVYQVNCEQVMFSLQACWHEKTSDRLLKTDCMKNEGIVWLGVKHVGNIEQ